MNTRNTDAEYPYAELVKAQHSRRYHGAVAGRTPIPPERHLIRFTSETTPSAEGAFLGLRFAVLFPDVLTVLSGMTYMEHLQDNLRTFSPLFHVPGRGVAYWKIPPSRCCNTHRAVQQLQIRMPCPYGLDIPAIFFACNRCISGATCRRTAKTRITANAAPS